MNNLLDFMMDTPDLDGKTYRVHLDPNHPEHDNADFFKNKSPTECEILRLNFALNHFDCCWRFGNNVSDQTYRETVHAVFKEINRLDPEYKIGTDLESDWGSLWSSPWSVDHSSFDPDGYIETVIGFDVCTDEGWLNSYRLSDDPGAGILLDGIEKIKSVLGYGDCEARGVLESNFLTFEDEDQPVRVTECAQYLMDRWIKTGDLNYLVKREELINLCNDHDYEVYEKFAFVRQEADWQEKH